MEEAVMFGLPVALVMLGVPLWYSIGECKQGRMVEVRLFRWWLMCGIIVMVSMLSGLVFGVAGFIITNVPASRASQVSTDCRILSKGVDLRSAKMCIPRHLSHTSKDILQRSKFRCYFEYYWASVFKVEFKPYLSGLPVQAVAEAPREALPAYCRPGFGAAWRIKEMYQINGTYPCKYTPRNLERVDIAEEYFAYCKAEKLSVLNLVKQVWVVLFLSEQSIFSTSSQAGLIFWKALASVFVGICYSMFVTGLAKTVRQLRFMLFDRNDFTELDVVYFEARLQITCMFAASLFGAIWYGGQNEELNAGLNRFAAVPSEGSRSSKWWDELWQLIEAFWRLLNFDL